MKRHEAFAHQGVPKINRNQWHAQAEDGTHVLSVWEDKIRSDTAEAHIHNHSQDTFAIGDVVRVVLQTGVWSQDTHSMVTQSAEPDKGVWVVVGQEMRAIDHPRRHFLHVLKIRRASNAGAR